MKRIFLPILLGFFCLLTQAQTEETKVFDVVEQMPSFPGGAAELRKFLSTHVKYPVVAEENGIQGRVIATFVVERDGSISDVKVVKSVDPSLDNEAVRVIRSMPRWHSGKQGGKAVRVKYTIPVTFRLGVIDNQPTGNQLAGTRLDNTDADCGQDFIFETADIVPSYPEGEPSFQDVASKMIVYPEFAENNNVDGVVQMSFVVEKDGSISSVVQGKSSVTTYGYVQDDVSKTCHDLFIRAVKEGLQKMPKLTPASRDGQPVRYRMMIVAIFGASKNELPASPGTICVYIRSKHSVENIYTEDKKPFKDMHLYLVGNEYWISGINKPISALSNEDITTINKKSKDAADDLQKKHEENDNIEAVYDLTSYSHHQGIKRPQLKKPDGLDEYMKEHLSKNTETVSVVASFIVEKDGRVSCPVVERANDLKAAKNVIHCLRKTKGWQPAYKDGVPVRARISHFFSYKKVVTVVQMSVPVYRPRSIYNNYRRRY